MNTRVLELIKNPSIIAETDLKLLQSEAEKTPYAQSIRALYLYGINIYQPENYKEHLSKTAAYTTDKKILYQFINSDKKSKKEEAQNGQKENNESQIIINSASDELKTSETELVTETENPETLSVQNKFDVEKIINSDIPEKSEFVFVEGEKNRLLYEGEENFLEEKSAEVDIEASKESGQLVLKEEAENIDYQISINENKSEENISEQDIIEEPIIPEITEPSEPVLEKNSEPELVSHDISFGGIQDFLPEVKFSVPKNHLDYLNPPKKKEKYIAQEAEKKEPFIEKATGKEIKIDDNHGISFKNIQSVEILSTQKTEEIEVESEIKTQESESVKIEKTEETVSEWKPMSFSSNIPDALIGIKEDYPTEKPNSQSPEIEPTKPILENTNALEKHLDEIETERPIFNVSFFGDDVSKIEEKKEEPTPQKAITEDSKESNVGTFINTWQSWLKIDRPQKTEETSVKSKEKIIDNFIETNPKISQLKEESHYVVKEKKDDISHLMTETLARLYTEQKLYSKAIKAYELLSEKHPQKKDYFLGKIEEVKEIRKPQ